MHHYTIVNKILFKSLKDHLNRDQANQDQSVSRLQDRVRPSPRPRPRPDSIWKFTKSCWVRRPSQTAVSFPLDKVFVVQEVKISFLKIIFTFI